MKVWEMLQNFWHDEKGGESAEWPLIIALVALAAIGAWQVLGTTISNVVNDIGVQISSSTS